MAETDPTRSKGPFVADLRPGDRIVGFYLVREKRLEPFRDRAKGEYLHLMLTDRTGEILGRVWEEAATLAAAFAEGDVVKVAADVAEYQSRPQLVIQRLRRADDEEYDLADFQPTSGREVAAMLAEVRAAIEAIENPHLAALVRAFYDDRAFSNQLVRAPGARKVHHAYVGGLLEHLTEMLALAQPLVRAYPDLNADLLAAGILLHAVGKLDEFTWARDISYSDEGRLLGHLVLSSERVAAALAQRPDFPPELSVRVRHMLVAQHGRAEWGSPREPQTLEALALHHLENLTAQMGRFRSLLERREPGQSWTEYNRLLGRQLYVGGEAAGEGSDEAADEQPGELPLE